MENQLYIPKKLKVGYNKRSDTYSKKLAYVIYYDDKGVLKKQKSWEGWIEPEMGIDEFENKPLEGFVLNRNVGGAKLSYSHDVRIEKVRVYDPRGFEIEIDVPNVLFILNECTSTKGKGLEGQFIYGWNGQSLTLIPTSCEAYRESLEYTSIQGKEIDIKDLKPGFSYKTKKLKDLVYLGRFDWVEVDYYDIRKPAKKHVFVDINPNFNDDDITPDDFDDIEEYNEQIADIAREKAERIENGEDFEFLTLPNTKTLAVCNSEAEVSNYAELMDKFNTSKHGGTPVSFVEEIAKPKPKIVKRSQGYWENTDSENYYLKQKGGYIAVTVDAENRWDDKPSLKFELSYNRKLTIGNDGKFKLEYASSPNKKYTAEEIKQLGLVKLFVKLDTNRLVKANQYHS